MWYCTFAKEKLVKQAKGFFFCFFPQKNAQLCQDMKSLKEVYSSNLTFDPLIVSRNIGKLINYLLITRFLHTAIFPLVGEA